jgi:hypothetical protein
MLENKKIFLGYVVFFVLLGLFSELDIFLFQKVLGTVVFAFLPGYFFSLILFDKGRITKFERFFLSVGFSLLLPPLLTYWLHIHSSRLVKIDFFHIFFIYSVFCGLCVLFYVLLKRKIGNYKKNESLGLKIGDIWSLLFGYLFLVVLLFVFSSRQENIINRDSTYFYSVVRETIATRAYPKWRPGIFPLLPESYQPLYQFQLICWNVLSNIDLVFLVRFGMSWLLSLFLLPIYWIAIKLIGDKKWAKISILLIFTIPVLMTQLSISRPQTMFFYFIPIFVYLLINFLIKNKDYWKWLIIALSLTALLWKAHYLSLFFVPQLLFSLVIKKWKWIVGNKNKALVIFFGLLIIVYPYLKIFNIIAHINYLGSIVVATYQGVSLAGLLKGAITPKTYVANYALLLVPLVLTAWLLLITGRIKAVGGRSVWLWLCLFTLVYLSQSEILPRLGFVFYPDRVLPHLAIPLIIFASLSIRWLWLRGKVWLRGGLVLTLIVSLVITVYINFLPIYQTINKKEIEAVEYINQQPGYVLLATQHGNWGAVNQYGENIRIIDMPVVSLVKFFRDSDSEDAYEMIVGFFDHNENLEKDMNLKLESLKQYLLSVNNYNSLDRSKVILDLDRIIVKKASAKRFTDLVGDKEIGLFIMYSNVKDRSFFNRYQWWWKDYNAMDANLEKFDNERFFELVFDNKDVKVWKVKTPEVVKWGN